MFRNFLNVFSCFDLPDFGFDPDPGHSFYPRLIQQMEDVAFCQNVLQAERPDLVDRLVWFFGTCCVG